MTRKRVTFGADQPAGSVTKASNGTVYNRAKYSLSKYECEDEVVLTGDGHFLTIVHFEKFPKPCYIEGPGAWLPPIDYTSTSAQLAAATILTFSDSPTDAAIGTQTMAGTNPSRPVADIPVAIAELGELIGLIKVLGMKNLQLLRSKQAAGKVAEANLLYQFGIAPLVSDLSAILNFSEHIDKRVDELLRIQKEGGLSRRYRKNHPYVSTRTVYDASYSHNSLGPSFRSPRENVGREEAWGVAKWVPNSGHPFPKDAAALRNIASRAVYGMTIDTSTLWEAMPWSWLIDYGFTVGAYFAAHRNIVPAHCSQLYVCRTSTYEVTHHQAKDGNLVMPAFVAKTTRKTRRNVPFTTPLAHLPFLNARQMSIIASLGVLRMR